MNFSIESDIFRGPVDLLLYLVRRHEVEVSKIALADVTEKYLEYIDVLKEISLDTVGDFLEVASILIELKARAMLPRTETEEDPETELADPRKDLVQRLLLFKRFKDASSLLEDQGSAWQKRYARIADDLPTQKVDMADQPIHEVELWDLVSAFGRVLRDNRPVPQANITYDETPIHIYMKRIHARIVSHRRVSFTDLFEAGMHKSAMVGIFLAVLELTRHHNVLAQQSDLHSEIQIVANDGFSERLDVSNIDDYNPHSKTLLAGDPGSMVD
ncbi:MAG: segregation and condensation protein A [Pirellulales bacterium]